MRRVAPDGVSAAAVPSAAMTTSVLPERDHARDEGGAAAVASSMSTQGTTARRPSDFENINTAAADPGPPPPLPPPPAPLPPAMAALSDCSVALPRMRPVLVGGPPVTATAKEAPSGLHAVAATRQGTLRWPD